MGTATREPLSSSAARDAILSCHDDLRGLVEETIHCADRATTSARDLEPLKTHARALYQAFRTHVDFEEEILSTALRDVIGLGAMMQAEMEAGHERQRETLDGALSALEREAGDRLVENVRAVAGALLLDLTSEEHCLLHADLDELTIDSRGG